MCSDCNSRLAGSWYLSSVQFLSLRHFPQKVRNHETRSFQSRQNSVCLDGELPHHFPDAGKVFRGQARDGILRLVVLILYRVKFGQHALMQDSRNWNATALLAVKHDVLAMLQTT